MVVDYRKLNAIRIREHFPVPNIEETLNSLGRKSCFTVLDLMSGYYQIPVSDKSRYLTAFITPNGHYEFKRIPYGLANAPTYFMRLMTMVREKLNEDDIIIYMDDVLIATHNVEENIRILRKLFKVLQEVKLTLKLEKCSFFKKSIQFLGHIVSAGCVQPGIEKTKAVAEFKTPENIKEVQQFLGLSGYFRRFIKSYSHIALPLFKLLKKNTVFKWEQEEQSAFENLKRALCDKPVLTLFNFHTKHELHTDASSHGIAGIIMQYEEDGIKPVSYFSRTTTFSESRFHSYELETLAVVESLERFKYYLLNKHFVIVTDCNSLRLTQEKKI